MCKERSNICSCKLFNILSSLLVAVGIAVVFYIGLITSISVLVYITLILGILGLIGLFVIIFGAPKYVCDCINKTSLISSSIGAIITSAFALALTSLVALSIPVAILIGIIAFFLVLLVISIIELLICIFCNQKNCYYED